MHRYYNKDSKTFWDEIENPCVKAFFGCKEAFNVVKDKLQSISF